MSKSATSSIQGSGAGVLAWQLAQTFWVGGVWFVQFVVLPALLHRTELAPLLVEDAARGLRPLVIGLAAVCVALQAFVLVRALGLSALWQDLRGQILSIVGLLSCFYLVLAARAVETGYWLMFSYLAVAFFGLMLVLQPVPRPRLGAAIT